MTKISRDQVQQFRQQLRELEARPKDSFSNAQVVAELADEIRAALDRGYTLADLHSYLAGQGFDLGLATFRTYWARATAGKRATRKRARPGKAAIRRDKPEAPPPPLRPDDGFIE